MKHGNGLPDWIRKSSSIVLLALAGSIFARSQEPSTPTESQSQSQSMAAAIQQLQEQVRELRAAVAEVRSEAAQYRAETGELRRELQSTRDQLASTVGPAQPGLYPATTTGATQESGGAAAASRTGSWEERVSSLEESSQLLSGKVDDQYQTKVESASKYRVRLSGIVLLNLFTNHGTPDNFDFPNYVPEPTPFDSKGATGASLRQSQLGLEVFGPRLAGAKTTGNVQFDLSGGFPNTLNGTSFGLFRLRIANMRMDWDKTSIVAGQDNAFFSPLSPTSFASLAVPTFGYAGNLWGWIPQVRVEHRFDLSNGQNILLQGGILDNVTGEPPPLSFDRLPQAGERSSQPAYAFRVSWSRNIFGQPLRLGTGAYYSRQEWWLNRHVDGWAGMADWEIPLAARVSLSGEFYRGVAVGGLGGGIGRSVLFDGNPFDSATRIRPLNSMGGWSQLKFKATSKLEFNGAFGMDSPFAEDVRAFYASQSYVDPTLVQNRSALVNFIYRPRSNLLFSSEFRHLRTFEIDRDSHTAEQVNLMMGILF
ncbi:MAG TPA: hypothetical protein VK555_02905 [Terriglobales bacterium]|nr:hypothetical protein [Terriglobales bacterium]